MKFLGVYVHDPRVEWEVKEIDKHNIRIVQSFSPHQYP